MFPLNLVEVERGEVRVAGEIPPDDPLWEGVEPTLTEPLVVELRATSVGPGVLLRGTLRTTVAADCRRCTEPVHVEVDEEVDLLFEPLANEEEDELAGEVYPLPDKGDVLDLGPALREQLLLAVPTYVVCREECRGLCPQCGANRNETECECVPEAGSSPWDALKKLKID